MHLRLHDDGWLVISASGAVLAGPMTLTEAEDWMDNQEHCHDALQALD